MSGRIESTDFPDGETVLVWNGCVVTLRARERLPEPGEAGEVSGVPDDPAAAVPCADAFAKTITGPAEAAEPF